MKLARLWIAGCLCLLACRQPARAQFVPLHMEGTGTYSLAPLAAPDGALFASSTDVGTRASVGGRTISEFGEIEIGFDYIRPYWSHRDFTLAVPTANAGSFPLLGDTGHVDNHFSLAPKVNLKYDVSDLFAVKATGTFLNLTGHLQRTVTSADGGVGMLTANSSMTIVTATFPEITTRFYFDELFPNHTGSHFDDLSLDLSFGTRYGSIEQNYTGKLNNSTAAGLNESQRYSTQSFSGIGITSALHFLCPLQHEAWSLYTTLRGSVLVGDNDKDSSLSVTIAGMPGKAASIVQSETEFIPVGEFETGVQWTHLFRNVNVPDAPQTAFIVRVGLSAQVWGNVGPLSAGSTQGFETSNLYLFGGHVMIGLAR